MSHFNRLVSSIIIGSIAWLAILWVNSIGVPLFSGILTGFGLLVTILMALIEIYTVKMPD